MRFYLLPILALLFCSFSFAVDSEEENDNVDSLLKVLQDQDATLDLQSRYELNLKIAEGYGHLGTEEYDKSIKHFLICYNIAKELNDLTKKSESLFNLGYISQRQNNFQDALVYFNDVVEHTKNESGNEYLARAYTQLSSLHQSIGDYKSAFENQMQALSIYNISNDTLGKINAHYNIGNIFYYQGQYEKALESYNTSKSLADDLGNARANYACLAALGSVYEKLENYGKSIEFNLASLRLAEKLQYKTGIAFAKGNLATNYKKQGKMNRAEKAMKESIAMKMEVGNKVAVIGSKIDLSNLYLKWEKPELALLSLEEALAMAIEVDAKGRQPEIYQSLAAVYDQINDPVNALLYTRKYIGLKDSLISEKTVEEMGKSKQRYEVREQEHEIAILKKTNEILNAKEEIRQQQIYIFAIAFIAFLMFLWWYKSKLNYQNKVNKLLGEKNTLLADKNEEIFIKNKQLENSNEDLQQFAYVASHDLKEPLRMINSYTTLLKRRYNDLFDESGQEFMFYVIDAVKRMETLLDDLLDFSRAGTQPPPENFISLEDIMVIVEANLRHRLETLNATLVIKNENLPKVKAHRTQLIQLLQNLVSNGVKFKGERDPQVTIDCVLENNQYVMSIADNGIGISKENLEKVFEMFRRLHTRDEYEGTGIGLATCKRIVTTWGGDIWVESEVDKGSTFFFSFPVSVASMEQVNA
ncbi:MAG: tetratricopeptide repeat protein [Saprospiraceae bacterium]